jgi:DNA (cytosine-5)-methyltransferase 1
MSDPLRVLDLFSGIGGFSLGLERAGMQAVAFCEVDPWCRRILAKHWPGVPIYEDVRTLAATDLGPVDVIAGGFPCQDISVAGNGAGITGERSGLWSEFARLIGEIRPRYAIIENVAALLDRGLCDVLGDLAALGYDAEWHCIPASHVGAPHRRDRVWIVAYPDQPRLEGRLREVLRQRAGERAVGESGDPWDGNWFAEPDVGRVADGIPRRMDRLKGLGNAVVPQIPELIGRAINLEAEV